MRDLLDRKATAEQGVSLHDLAAEQTTTVAQAAERLGIHEFDEYEVGTRDVKDVEQRAVEKVKNTLRG